MTPVTRSSWEAVPSRGQASVLLECRWKDVLGEGDVKKKTETGERQPQAKECQRVPTNPEKQGRDGGVLLPV